MLEVTKVELSAAVPDLLAGFAVDVPREGETLQEGVLHVGGWVLGRSSLAQAVELAYDGSVIRRAPVNRGRPDVAEVYPGFAAAEKSGFDMVVRLLGIAHAEVLVTAELADGSRVLLGRLSLQARVHTQVSIRTVFRLALRLSQSDVACRLRRALGPTRSAALRRTTPVSAVWGFDRGTPVDRYYIDRFLEMHRDDIRGRVLEIRDSTYTGRYGSQVSASDILDINGANPEVTIVADLSAAGDVPSHQFDCFILTQTLQFIYDTREAIRHAHRLLAVGGVLLTTVPAVSKVGHDATDYWRFTAAACQELFGDIFGRQNVEVTPYGNVLTATSFLMGLAAEELRPDELDVRDDDFPVIVAVRASRTALHG